MLPTLLFILIVVPVLAALGCYFLRASAIRNLIVLATAGLVAAASVLLALKGDFTYPGETFFAMSTDVLVTILDFALLLVMFYYGVKLRNMIIKVVVGLEILALAYLELFLVDHGAQTVGFFADQLSIIMVLIISIVGSLVCLFAIPYMRRHEEHLKLEHSKQPRFFFFLVLFLGAMNALVLTNNILWFFFFFEVTTFCCFMLISHDGTEIARANGERALWMNAIAGLSLVLGILWGYTECHTLAMDKIIAAGPMGGAMLAPLGLLIFAGFVKSAQIPFQSWLLGAMIAPTPVSALLHSSTMVKAGVYLALRMAPAFEGTFFSTTVALCGAFTLMVTSALAVGQSNGKKILAYSTIGNLGLVFACAGINTPEAITAGILLIIFHAVSKGCLFMCVGTIEQHIGSRDIEDMRGLYAKMPRLTVITVIAIVTMFLPPFGVLLSKWMVIEAASNHIVVVALIAMGSALMLMYYARWAGMLLSGPFHERIPGEHLELLVSWPLKLLIAMAVVLSVGAPLIYTGMIQSMLKTAPFNVFIGTLTNPVGAFAVYPLFVLLGIGFVYARIKMARARRIDVAAPYMSGAQLPGFEARYKGPMQQPVHVTASNYYLATLFGESKLTGWVNLAGIALIILMLGGAL